MFEIVQHLLSEFIDILPYLIGLYLIFEFTGSLLLGKR